jgi:hypothetical protein
MGKQMSEIAPINNIKWHLKKTATTKYYSILLAKSAIQVDPIHCLWISPFLLQWL